MNCSRFYMNASIAFLAVVVFFVSSQELSAGPCKVVSTNHNVVATPSYSVSGNHALIGSHYNQFVPVVQQVQVVPDFFYSSAGYARDEALLEALKIIKEARSNAPASKVEAKRSDDGFGGLLDDLPEIGGKTSLSTTRSGSELASLVEEKCIRCHNGSKGHLNLSNLNGLSPSVKVGVYEAVAEGSMPPSGALSKEQKRVFREWAIGK